MDANGTISDGNAVVEALYRPVRTVLAYRVPEGSLGDGEDEPETPSERLATLLRAPNAMRPDGWARAGGDAELAILSAIGGHVPQPGRWMAFDRDGTFLGAYGDAEFLSAWRPCCQDPYLHYASAGETFAIRLGPEGVLSGPRGRMGDGPRDALAGLGRVDADGIMIAEADAPLALQAATLLGEGDDEASSHLIHVSALAQALSADGGNDPGSWIDLSTFDALMSDVGDGTAEAEAWIPAPSDLAASMVSEMDEAVRADPMWALGLPWQASPADWVSRDTPGAGALWRIVDGAFAAMPPGNAPGKDAQCVPLPAGEPVPAGLRRWFGEAAPVAASGNLRLARDAATGFAGALVERDGLSLAVAWGRDGAGGDRRDPLRAEELVGFVPDADGAAEGPGSGNEEARLSLSGLDLLAVLPDPPVFPGYAAAVLAREHAAGGALADLCASLARLVRDGGCDTAFMSDADGPDEGLTEGERDAAEAVAARADRARGVARPLLTAMLAGVDPEAWAEVEITRDVSVLLDAGRAGGTLLDLADVVADLDEGDLP